MAVLELRNVSKSYGTGRARVHALVEADLTVEPGEMVAVMGSSGSGKSTLLAIAGALAMADRGEVLVDGSRVGVLPPRKRAALRRRAIGYVYQDFNLLPGLTAAENVAVPLELDRVSPRRALLAALRALGQVGLCDYADSYPGELSGGQRQRVAIARAIVCEHRLLLADEPTGALDSVAGESIMRLIRKACRDGQAAVVVTHDAQVAAWADRIIFLSDGRIIDRTAPIPGPEVLLVGLRSRHAASSPASSSPASSGRAARPH
jgi:putative ABC transport system ATP-binding protein